MATPHPAADRLHAILTLLGVSDEDIAVARELVEHLAALAAELRPDPEERAVAEAWAQQLAEWRCPYVLVPRLAAASPVEDAPQSLWRRAGFRHPNDRDED